MGRYILLFWGIATILVCIALPSLRTALKGPIAWESVDFSSDIEGLYVSGTVYGIYDWYCEEYDNDDVLSREYLIDADGYYYMGLRAESKDMYDADMLMDATYAYLSGQDDGSLMQQMQYEVYGIIKPIPAEHLALYHEYVGWSELDEESKAMFLPYYIAVNKFGAYDYDELGVIAIVFVVCFLLGCRFFIFLLSGHYQKSVKKYIANSTNPDMTRERVEYFIQNTTEVKGLRYNRDFICGHQNGTTAFGEMSKLAWVYLNTTSHKQYFITIGKTHSLMLCFTDGSRQPVEVKNEAVAWEHIRNLSQLCPQTIFGYNEELDKLFSKDLAGFLEICYNNADPTNTIL